MKSLSLSFLLCSGLLSASPYAAEKKQFSKETSIVKSFLENHKVNRVFSWCRTDKLNCRSSIQYVNKKSGKVVNSFENRFMSSEPHRSVSARAFYIEQPDGTFNVYAQDKMSNQIEIDSVNPVNQGISVIFDEFNSNLPTFEVSFEIIGSDPVEYKKAILSYSNGFARVILSLQYLFIR